MFPLSFAPCLHRVICERPVSLTFQAVPGTPHKNRHSKNSPLPIPGKMGTMRALRVTPNPKNMEVVLRSADSGEAFSHWFHLKEKVPQSRIYSLEDCVGTQGNVYFIFRRSRRNCVPPQRRGSRFLYQDRAPRQIERQRQRRRGAPASERSPAAKFL